jgi:hypothetical protein
MDQQTIDSDELSGEQLVARVRSHGIVIDFVEPVFRLLGGCRFLDGDSFSYSGREVVADDSPVMKEGFHWKVRGRDWVGPFETEEDAASDAWDKLDWVS